MATSYARTLSPHQVQACACRIVPHSFPYDTWERNALAPSATMPATGSTFRSNAVRVAG